MRHIVQALFLVVAMSISCGQPEPVFFHTVHLLVVPGEVVGVQGADGLVQLLEVELQGI